MEIIALMLGAGVTGHAMKEAGYGNKSTSQSGSLGNAAA